MSPIAQALGDLRYFASASLDADTRARFASQCRSVAAGIIASSCPPVGINEVSQVVTTPGTSGPRVGIRLSNLDLYSTLVKRGATVSHFGLHGIVVRVSRGRCCVGYLDAFQRFTGKTDWLICEHVQVVASPAHRVRSGSTRCTLAA